MNDNTFLPEGHHNQRWDIALPDTYVAGTPHTSEEKLITAFDLEEIDSSAFLKGSFWKDLIVLYDSRVVGKGLNCKIQTAYVYIERNNEKFIVNFKDKTARMGAYELEYDKVVFVVEDDVENVYMVLISSEGPRMFRLSESVTVSIYFETELYRGRGRYYGCMVRDVDGFKFCNISPDPKTADFLIYMYNMVIDEAEE